jgi:hypothetical protein
MFSKISSKIQYPSWVAYCERYRLLDLYDRLLDGKFYAHLPYAFFDEVERHGAPIKLEDRRPSAQYRFATQVASYCARKLFAGNHAPRVMHKDDATRKKILALLRKARFMPRMLEIAKLGSVGAVAATFRVKVNDGVTQITIKIHRAKFCDPSFDDMDNLVNLRVQYVVQGSNLIKAGAPPPQEGQKIYPRERYWFIRDYGAESEITWNPIAEADWNPIDGFVNDETRRMEVWEDVQHGLGFVPGHWFCNLTGGVKPDGACTFEPGIGNSIEIDYLLSQMGRGVRYSAAPTLVIKGKIISGGDGEGMIKGPAFYIHLQEDLKDEEGTTMGGSDAKLLEMNGTGTEAALKLVDKLHDTALEAVAAARKDPEKMKGPMSGRAMEFIDQEFYDLVMELRAQYGEHGALELARKIVQAVEPETDLSSFTLVWPRLFQPTPADLGQVIPALAIAIDPLKAGPAMPAEPGGSGPDGTSKPGKPATSGPDPEFMLLTPEQARTWLASNMDMHLLNDDDESPEEPTESRPGAAPEDQPNPVDTTRAAPSLEGGIPRPTDVTLDV